MRPEVVVHKQEIFSVGASQDEMMGPPGLFGLWIFELVTYVESVRFRVCRCQVFLGWYVDRAAICAKNSVISVSI